MNKKLHMFPIHQAFTRFVDCRSSIISALDVVTHLKDAARQIISEQSTCLVRWMLIFSCSDTGLFCHHFLRKEVKIGYMLCTMSKALYCYLKIFFFFNYIYIYIYTCKDTTVLLMILWSMAQVWPAEEGWGCAQLENIMECRIAIF